MVVRISRELEYAKCLAVLGYAKRKKIIDETEYRSLKKKVADKYMVVAV